MNDNDAAVAAKVLKALAESWDEQTQQVGQVTADMVSQWLHGLAHDAGAPDLALPEKLTQGILVLKPEPPYTENRVEAVNGFHNKGTNMFGGYCVDEILDFLPATPEQAERFKFWGVVV